MIPRAFPTQLGRDTFAPPSPAQVGLFLWPRAVQWVRVSVMNSVERCFAGIAILSFVVLVVGVVFLQVFN